MRSRFLVVASLVALLALGTVPALVAADEAVAVDSTFTVTFDSFPLAPYVVLTKSGTGSWTAAGVGIVPLDGHVEAGSFTSASSPTEVKIGFGGGSALYLSQYGPEGNWIF